MTINTLKSSVALRLLFCCGIAVLSAFLMRGVIRYNHMDHALPAGSEVGSRDVSTSFVPR